MATLEFHITCDVLPQSMTKNNFCGVIMHMQARNLEALKRRMNAIRMKVCAVSHHRH
jgi:hypothetical protein